MISLVGTINMSLNSTLVQFKHPIVCGWISFLFRSVSIPLWFNSNYRGCSIRNRMGRIVVSIPLWFNSNIPGEFGGLLKDLLSSSQFHFGSIQTPAMKPLKPWARRRCLNSTLVQFKHITFINTFQFCRRVSIPLWFNSNVHRKH